MVSGRDQSDELNVLDGDNESVYFQDWMALKRHTYTRPSGQERGSDEYFEKGHWLKTARLTVQLEYFDHSVLG